MSEFDKISASAAREAVSAVRLTEQLTAEVDGWAEANGMVRSDAISRLLELGLNASASGSGSGELDSVAIEAIAIEAMAVTQIDHLLDPLLAPKERERRIRRLTEGPPEFADQRIDLPKPKK